MDKLELYHIHMHNEHNKNWVVGKTLDIKPDFKNKMYERYSSFGTNVADDNGNDITLYNYLILYLNHAKLFGINPDEARDLLYDCYRIAYYASMFKRESSLENYRLNHVSNLPSRLHSIYLTDEKGLKGWEPKIAGTSDKYDIYRVEAEGNIFKTSEYFLPPETTTYEESYSKAHAYWFPNFKKVDDDANEYLVQGKVKVLECIKDI